MKIKICSPLLGLSPKSQLGGENHDYKIISALCKKGFRCEVLLPKNRPYKEHKNLNVEYLPLTHIFPPHIFNLLALPYLIKKYRQCKFDILRIHSPYYLGLAALVFRKMFPQPKIVTSIHLVEKRPDFKWILKKTIHLYDHIFTVSNYLKRWLVDEYKIKPNKITVIYSGVGEELKPQSKDKTLINKFNLDNKIVLLNLGLMDERKNVLFLLELYIALMTRYDNLVLMLIGSGPLKQKLLERVKQLKLTGKVFVLPPVFGKEKNKYYNLADIFLFPSTNEGFGAVAAEAMGCAKPVIASRNTSLPEVIDDKKTGYLATTNDLKDWVNKAEILINDEDLREHMGRVGYKKALSIFNWKTVVDKTIKEYNDLIQ